MAKFKPILGELSGKIAGNVFSHNKGGSYVRQHAVPVNRNSAGQQTVRGSLASTSADWQSLTDNERSQWTQYAAMNTTQDALGNTIVLTGQQAFVGLNARLARNGLAAISVPPITTNEVDLGNVSVTVSAPATIACTWDGGNLPTGTVLEVLTSPAGSAGRDPNFATARHAAVSSAAATSPVTVVSERAVVAGQTVNVWLRAVDAYGQASVPQKARAVAG